MKKRGTCEAQRRNRILIRVMGYIKIPIKIKRNFMPVGTVLL